MSMYVPDIKEELSENAKMLVCEEDGKFYRTNMPGGATVHIVEAEYDGESYTLKSLDGKDIDFEHIYDMFKPFVFDDFIIKAYNNNDYSLALEYRALCVHRVIDGCIDLCTIDNMLGFCISQE